MSEPIFEASAPTTDIRATSSVSGSARKQEFNIYTLMLIISFVALVAGTLLLFLEVREYGPFPGSPWKTTDGIPQLSWLGDFISSRWLA